MKQLYSHIYHIYFNLLTELKNHNNICIYLKSKALNLTSTKRIPSILYDYIINNIHNEHDIPTTYVYATFTQLLYALFFSLPIRASNKNVKAAITFEIDMERRVAYVVQSNCGTCNPTAQAFVRGGRLETRIRSDTQHTQSPTKVFVGELAYL